MVLGGVGRTSLAPSVLLLALMALLEVLALALVVVVPIKDWSDGH